MSPEELAALEREQPVDCPKCGWWHRPSRPCLKTKWTPKLAERIQEAGTDQSRLAALKGDAAIEKLRELGERADAALAKGESQPTPTGKRCPTCGAELYHYRNILGREWDGYPDDLQGYVPIDEHTKECGRPKPMVPEDIKPPRRVYNPGSD